MQVPLFPLTTITACQRAISRGLSTLKTQQALPLSRWATESFYLSKESSYVEGNWSCLPWQVAIMDCISHDDIEVVNWIKSARVGATKIMLAANAYFASHRQRNQLFYQPTDGDAKEFVQTELNPMIRDVPEVQRVFPYYGRRTQGNSDSLKLFAGCKLIIKGGKSAGNYRRLSTDVVFYDELEAFDKNIEGEGDPLTLGDKRLEGSFFPKSVRGTTPKTKNDSLIERAVEQSGHLFKYHVPCPHCQKEQILEWGGPDAEFGIKWQDKDPASAHYVCSHCQQRIDNGQLTWMNDQGRWIDQHGNWIDTSSLCSFTDGEATFLEDGELVFRNSKEQIIKPPKRVSFHIWTVYSPFTQWAKIVETWLDALDTLRRESDKGGLQSFVNTFLGETWAEEEGERPDWESLYTRREHYPTHSGKLLVPRRALWLSGFVDVQGDRFEYGVYGWNEHGENWLIDYQVLVGNLSQPPIWNILFEHLQRNYANESGQQMPVHWGIDSGGHYTQEVYQFCRRFAPGKIYPTKGSSDLQHPLFDYPRSLNKHGLRLVMVGTKQAKDIIYNWLTVRTDNIDQPTAGYCHAPIADIASETYFKQLTAEEKVMVRHKGRWVFAYDAKGRRNEALDIAVGALVVQRIHEQHHGLNLARLQDPTPTKNMTLADIAKGLSNKG